MKEGDLVKIYKRNHWGGIAGSESKGIIVKRVYQAYSEDNTEWEVYVNGKVKRLRGKNLIEIKKRS